MLVQGVGELVGLGGFWDGYMGFHWGSMEFWTFGFLDSWILDFWILDFFLDFFGFFQFFWTSRSPPRMAYTTCTGISFWLCTYLHTVESPPEYTNTM